MALHVELLLDVDAATTQLDNSNNIVASDTTLVT
jgi:hypothetical protein